MWRSRCNRIGVACKWQVSLLGHTYVFIRPSLPFTNPKRERDSKNSSPHSPSLRALPREKVSCLVWRMRLLGPLATGPSLGLGEMGEFYAILDW